MVLKEKKIFEPEKLADINLTNIDERLKEKDHYDDPVWAELAAWSCPRPTT